MDKSSEFHVRVEQGGVVTHWTASATNLPTVKRKATKLKADLVEITDADGVMWTRELTDTRWRMSVPARPTVTTMDEIRARMTVLAAEHRELNIRLNAFRVKCPTCSCRILPDETCRCCVGREMLTRIMQSVPQPPTEAEVEAMDQQDTPGATPARNLNSKLN